jgi:plastocyanin
MALALVQLRCGENPLQPDVPGPNEIWIRATGFDPATLTVAVGTTVTWIHKDNTAGARHGVTSGLPGYVENLFGPSDNLTKPNDSYSTVLNQKRTYDYFCDVHRNTGKIIVQ